MFNKPHVNDDLPITDSSNCKFVVGENIRKLREERRLTQKDLVEKCFVSQQAVAKWENEKQKCMPQLDRIYDIAKIFSVSVNDIITKSDPDKEYFIPLDRTEFVKNRIKDLKEKIKRKRLCNSSYGAKNDLNFYKDKLALHFEELSLSKTGKCFVYLKVTEQEYKIYLELKKLNPYYSTENFFAYLLTDPALVYNSRNMS